MKKKLLMVSTLALLMASCGQKNVMDGQNELEKNSQSIEGQEMDSERRHGLRGHVWTAKDRVLSRWNKGREKLDLFAWKSKAGRGQISKRGYLQARFNHRARIKGVGFKKLATLNGKLKCDFKKLYNSSPYTKFSPGILVNKKRDLAAIGLQVKNKHDYIVVGLLHANYYAKVTGFVNCTAQVKGKPYQFLSEFDLKVRPGWNAVKIEFYDNKLVYNSTYSPRNWMAVSLKGKGKDSYTIHEDEKLADQMMIPMSIQ